MKNAKHGGQQIYNHSVFVENEDINCISIYKLGDNTTHPRKVSIFKISFSVTTANREFTLAIISLRKFIKDPGGGHCPLTRGSEPIRFLRIPKTVSFYMLIMVVLRVRKFTRLLNNYFMNTYCIWGDIQPPKRHGHHKPFARSIPRGFGAFLTRLTRKSIGMSFDDGG